MLLTNLLSEKRPRAAFQPMGSTAPLQPPCSAPLAHAEHSTTRVFCFDDLLGTVSAAEDQHIAVLDGSPPLSL